MDLTTKYMGLKLKNPIIAGSSGLTSNLADILELEKAGASAIVLKSLFEEQILHNYKDKVSEVNLGEPYPEAHEYISRHTKQRVLEDYLDLVSRCKKVLTIPVIASINCITPYEWPSFAGEIEAAGADALELNIFFLPSDPQRMGALIEENYIEILNQVLMKVSIPVSVKVSPYFSGLSNALLRFSFTGIKGMVLFNRFFSPDIDIEELKVTAGPVFSSPDDINLPLRWIAMLADRIYCDIAASSGVHDGKALVKVLLAGAKAAEVVSICYTLGPSAIGKMLKFLEDYLQRHNYSSVSEIIGKMSLRQVENPADYERVQFLKYYSGIE
ncbi:MAG: dihydroorotate dehydrogenase-like protein [Bacteroidetes bacterium]|nr:dihydroorotate dehydrogenase-like protein [Bacteroidota bacterium]